MVRKEWGDDICKEIGIVNLNLPNTEYDEVDNNMNDDMDDDMD